MPARKDIGNNGIMKQNFRSERFNWRGRSSLIQHTLHLEPMKTCARKKGKPACKKCTLSIQEGNKITRSHIYNQNLTHTLSCAMSVVLCG